MDSEAVSSLAIRNVAMATDFSPSSERALQHSLAIARHFGATLHFVHFVRPSQFVYAPEMIPTVDEIASRDFEQLLATLRTGHRLDGIEFRRWVLEGEVSEVTRKFIESHAIDLLVLGTHGRAGIPRLLLGSVAQEIFHYVRCPVLTVGPCSPGAGFRPQLRRVLYSTDLSPESLAALPYVLTAIRDWHAQVDVVHVCSSSGGNCKGPMKDLKETIEALRAGEEAATIRYHVLSGNPASCVVGFARENSVDLIVLGLKPRRALYSGPLWSHAYEIVRRTPCPVLSVRSLPAARSAGASRCSAENARSDAEAVSSLG